MVYTTKYHFAALSSEDVLRQGFAVVISVDGKGAPEKTRRLAVEGRIGDVEMFRFHRNHLGI